MPAPTSSPTPRRVGLPRWLDARLIAGVVLVVASVSIGARLVAAAQARAQVVAFTRDLAAGTIVRATDLNYVRVYLPRGQSALYADRPSAVSGKRLDRPVTRGELATRADLRQADPATTMVLPFSAAAAPVLNRGERVVVWAAVGGCSLGVLVDDATVQGVDRGGDGAGIQSAGSQRVTLDLPDEVAARVVAALARDGVTLRAGVLRGGPHPHAPTAASLPDPGQTSCTG